MSGARRGRRGRHNGTKHGDLVTYDEDSLGPDWFDEPLPEFPFETKREFQREGHELRIDGAPPGIWPKCEHGLDCVVQFLHVTGNWHSGRRFFRCPVGTCYDDEDNCKWTHWVDPPVNGILQEYIAHLQNKIFDLQAELEKPSLSDSIQTISIANDDVQFCDNLHCPCPHHNAGLARGPPSAPAPAPAAPAPPPPQAQPQPPYYDDYYSQGSSNHM